MSLRPGSLVTVAFPFTGLSGVKRRPALVLVAGREDVVLCAVTSKLSGRHDAVPISRDDLVEGRLPKRSEIRPLKLFTIHRSLLRSVVGQVSGQTHARVVDLLVEALRPGVRRTVRRPKVPVTGTTTSSRRR